MRATIFVTDDDEVVRTAITRRLAKRQHDIRSFDSGEALIEALDHDIPDLILLDLKMTGMTGLQTLKHIRPQGPSGPRHPLNSVWDHRGCRRGHEVRGL